VPDREHSAKTFLKKIKGFAECQIAGTRQSNFFKIIKTLPSAESRALGKARKIYTLLSKGAGSWFKNKVLLNLAHT
jgi:hypothetical protein